MTVAGAETAAAYDAFAPYYDAFTSESDYEAWGRETLAHARRHGLRGDRMLDLACGTGMSFVPFLARGFHVTGCDFSTAMLAEAARRAPAARLVHADIRALPDLGRFDLITCFDDALNYLLSGEELAAAFEGMERSLTPDGVAIFDLNSLSAYRTTFAVDSVTHQGDLVFAWRGRCSPDAPPGCEAVAELDVFEPAEAGLYSRARVTHGSATSSPSAWSSCWRPPGSNARPSPAFCPTARWPSRPTRPSTRRSSTPPGTGEEVTTSEDTCSCAAGSASWCSWTTIASRRATSTGRSSTASATWGG